MCVDIELSKCRACFLPSPNQSGWHLEQLGGQLIQSLAALGLHPLVALRARVCVMDVVVDVVAVVVGRQLRRRSWLLHAANVIQIAVQRVAFDVVFVVDRVIGHIVDAIGVCVGGGVFVAVDGVVVIRRIAVVGGGGQAVRGERVMGVQAVSG